MQHPTAEPAQAPTAVPVTPAGSIHAEVDHIGQLGPDRAREELSMLLVGFATGLSIGAVFLIYIVLEVAKVL